MIKIQANKSLKEKMNFNSLIKSFKEVLKKNSLKYTSQRELIIKTLYKNINHHFSPEELHKYIRKYHPNSKIGIATIYRTLNLLENENLVTSISFGQDGKVYELNIGNHHDHMICLECGKIIEFEDIKIEKRQIEICNKYEFELKNHVMQLYGICKSCKSKLKEK